MRGMNPTIMLRMRDQMTHELQQIQRQLGFIDPQDTQLQKTLKDMQAELLAQLKDVNTQLKEQGVPLPDEALDALGAAATGKPNLPAIPPETDPTLIPGGMPQPATKAEDIMVQRRTTPDEAADKMVVPRPMTKDETVDNMIQPPPRNPLPNGMMGGFIPGQHGGMLGMPPGGMGGMPPAVPPNLGKSPTEFDQDQAWADSPWAPKPSKELSELKQTVDGLRKELGEMRETVKALETQIQLLNRNILLMNPAPAK